MWCPTQSLSLSSSCCLYQPITGLLSLYVLNICLFSDSDWIALFFSSSLYHLTKYFDELLISKPFSQPVFCLVAGFEKFRSTESFLREGLSVGSSLAASSSFSLQSWPLDILVCGHNSEMQLLSFLKFLFILWNFHAIMQCCLLKSIHLYLPATPPIAFYPTLPNSCGPLCCLFIVTNNPLDTNSTAHMLLRVGPPTEARVTY